MVPRMRPQDSQTMVPETSGRLAHATNKQKSTTLDLPSL